MKHHALALLAFLTACEGASGTVVLDLTTAPGSTVLDNVERLRITLTNPRRAFETTRTADGGFDLTIEVEAGVSAALIVEGFDGSGGLVATGMSPEFGFGPTDAHVVIFIAPPMSIARAPVMLLPSRLGVSGATNGYGAVFAGGHSAMGVPSDELQIYNAFDHTLVSGLAAPIARTGVALAVSTTGVYLYGGTDAMGVVDATLLRFDMTARPSGAYEDLGEFPGYARVDARAARIGAERFLITGAPPLELANNALTARTELDDLPATAAALPDGSAAMFVGGPTGLVRFTQDTFDTLDGDPTRQRAAIAALPSGMFVVIGGGDVSPWREALLVDPLTAAVTRRADTLAIGRYAPAVAATEHHLVIAGGVDENGVPIATAEVLDANTLAPLAVLPIAPRADALALPLPNGQVLIAGGDASSEVIELFTPPPPEQ